MPDRRQHFDWVADHDATARRGQRAFHATVAEAVRRRIAPGDTALEVGCGRGELLRTLPLRSGVGLDFSLRMLEQARERARPGERIEFLLGDVAADPLPAGTFDHLILDYLVGYLDDVQAVLERLQDCAHPRTRLHLLSLNTLWLPVLGLGVATGRVVRQPPSNWLAHTDLANLLELAGWEVIANEHCALDPLGIPLLEPFCNRFLARLPTVRHLASTLYLLARPRRAAETAERPLSLSVVVPARNEAGNIRAALDRIPALGASTEVIFVEGHSKDDTWAVIEREVGAYAGPLRLRALRQPGKGKWDAVRAGFDVATGDVLAIQDADLTAPPEDLPKFFEAIRTGRAEFANGSRLVYPMEDRAMRLLNLVGNKVFALALSFVLGQNVKDSLCGTKVLLRADYERLGRRARVWGAFDPFGDFYLLFGAALIGLRIRDIPVRYRDRTYGETNISRFRHGAMLLRMTWFGLWRIRFGRPPPPGDEGAGKDVS